MRRIVTFNRVSADGYFTGPEDNLDWFVPDEELDGAAADSIPQADTMLFGRRTYDMFESFWPHALDDSPTSQDPHNEGRRTEAIRAMAVWLNEAEKLVFSTTRTAVTWQNSRLLDGIDPAAIETLKNGPGRDIMIFGSGTIATQLTHHHLIDEYRFVVSPVLIGSGRPLIRDMPGRANLHLLEAKPFPSGNVLIRYERRS